MSTLKQNIRREITSRGETIVGTVIGKLRMQRFDQTTLGAPVWVVDIEVGSNNYLKNVPVKAGANGSRFYAQLGQTVLLRRNALGRFQVVAPGDRVSTPVTIKTYDLTDGSETGSADEGFQAQVVPFEFYLGPSAMKGNPDVTFAVTGGDDTITRSVGSFIDDGFAVSDSVRIGNTSANDGVVTITAVTALVMDTSATLTNEGPIGGVGIGVVGTSLWNDTVTPFPLSRVADAQGNPVA